MLHIVCVTTGCKMRNVLACFFIHFLQIVFLICYIIFNLPIFHINVLTLLATVLPLLTHTSCNHTRNSYSCRHAITYSLSSCVHEQLPDMTDTINDVNAMASDETIRAIRAGQQALDNVRETLNASIATDVRKVSKAIGEAGKSIRSVAYEMTNTFERISDVAGNNSFKNFDLADRYIEEFAKYHLWAGLGVSSVLLLVLLCVVCGLLCGICGKRPDGYGDDCCNKGAGSRFLMW